MTRCTLIATLCCLSLVACTGAALGSPGSVLVKSVARHLTVEGSEEATEKIAKEAGETFVERVAVKVVKEGGDETLERVSVLTAKHGADVIRALDNSPAVEPVLQALDALPADQVPLALTRLAAGTQGRALAQATIRRGASALRTEVAHPGVGGHIVHALGSEGASLCRRISTDQAILLARHVDDIAILPPSLRAQVLNMMSEQTDRFFKFLGRFAENNPKAVLFTTAGTSVFLLESERLLGDDEIMIGPDGIPQVVSKSGLLERVSRPLVEAIALPLRAVLWTACLILVMIGILTIRKWRKFWCNTPKQADPSSRN